MKNIEGRLSIRPILERYFSGKDISYREVFGMMLPIIVDQSFIVGLSIINTAMISGAGIAAISAVNMVESLNIFLINVFVAIATGGTVAVAQYKGKKNEKMVSKAAAGSISSVFLISLVIGFVLILFHNQVLNVLFGDSEKAVMDNARIYFIGCMLSYPAIGIVEAVCGALRGVGETRSSLILSLIMNLSYVLMNFFFIQGLNLGVLGMVISLNIARLLAAVCSFVFLIYRNQSLHFSFRRLFPIDFRMLKNITIIGVPFAAEQMFFNGGKILTQTFIVSLGTFAMTINAIASSLTSLMEILAGSLSLGLISIVGQCIGANNIADARKFIKSFLLLGTAATFVSALIVIPSFPLLISLYNAPVKIIPTIFQLTVIVGVARTFLWQISFMIPSGLRAAGDATYTSIISMTSMWLFRVVVGYLLGITFGYGILGVWGAMMLEWGVRGSIFLHRFKGNKWYRHHITE